MEPKTYESDPSLLRRILSDPTGTHADAEIKDNVRIGHVACAWSALHSSDASPMEAFLSGDRAVAWYVVLSHLGGGAAAGLPSPPLGLRDDHASTTGD
jgi:hypothetical protein